MSICCKVVWEAGSVICRLALCCSQIKDIMFQTFLTAVICLQLSPCPSTCVCVPACMPMCMTVECVWQWIHTAGFKKRTPSSLFKKRVGLSIIWDDPRMSFSSINLPSAAWHSHGVSSPVFEGKQLLNLIPLSPSGFCQITGPLKSTGCRAGYKWEDTCILSCECYS